MSGSSTVTVASAGTSGTATGAGSQPPSRPITETARSCAWAVMFRACTRSSAAWPGDACAPGSTRTLGAPCVVRCGATAMSVLAQFGGMVRSTVSCWLALTVWGVDVTSTVPEGVVRTSTM